MSANPRHVPAAAGAVLVGLLLVGGSVGAQGPEPSLESIVPSVARGDGLSIRDAWTRESMMADLAGAAYMVVRNESDREDVLVAAYSPAAAVVEIHQTSVDPDGAMVMFPVAGVPLPPGSDTLLEPGGYHIMLFDLVEPLVEGELIELTLEFAAADPLRVLVPVRATGPMGEEPVGELPPMSLGEPGMDDDDDRDDD